MCVHCVCLCVCVRVCMSVCECIVWLCEIGLMSCRKLGGNRITMIPSNVFTGLPLLQTLFVLCEWVTVRVYVCLFVCLFAYRSVFL